MFLLVVKKVWLWLKNMRKDCYIKCHHHLHLVIVDYANRVIDEDQNLNVLEQIANTNELTKELVSL